MKYQPENVVDRVRRAAALANELFRKPEFYEQIGKMGEFARTALKPAQVARAIQTFRDTEKNIPIRSKKKWRWGKSTICTINYITKAIVFNEKFDPYSTDYVKLASIIVKWTICIVINDTVGEKFIDEPKKGEVIDDTAPYRIQKCAENLMRDHGRMDFCEAKKHCQQLQHGINLNENMIIIDAERAYEVFEYAMKYNSDNIGKNTKAYVAGMLAAESDSESNNYKRFSTIFFPAILNYESGSALPDQLANTFSNFETGIPKGTEGTENISSPIIQQTWIDPIPLNLEEGISEVINHFFKNGDCAEQHDQPSD